jgi:hypothetical protein
MDVVTAIKVPLRALREGWRALKPALGVPTPAAPYSYVPAAPPPQRPPRRTFAVRVEETPNPNARKLVASVELHDGPSITATSPADAARSPVTRRLFEVAGVRSVFLARDFVTVTRDPGVPWPTLIPRLEAALQEEG